KATSHLATSELQCLEVATSDLARRRRKHAKRMLKILKGHRYSRFVTKLQQWLDQPHFQASAEWPIALVLPDLLSPLVNRLLLHPGWLTVIAQPLHPTAQVGDLRNTQIEGDLNRYGEVLHDLRKQFKRVRYQTEFFVPFYDAAYAKQTEEFKVLQDLLGELHDSQVQGEFLENTLGRFWPEVLPSVSDRLQQDRSDLWQQWLPLQQKYLNPVFRDQLRALLLHPQSNDTPQPLAS
ncbi:MAG TPA: CHAD domain-containing protein, partial [Stenomitos sp.]